MLTPQRPRRQSLHLNTIPSPRPATPSELYSDARTHGYQGSTRTVKLPRATPSGGGAISKSEDGLRCVVAGRESLRILRMSETPTTFSQENKAAAGRGGHRIDGSRNFWVGSGLKIDSVSTDVAWCRQNFSNKILTSARNGELIMWDLDKMGYSKYERRARDHLRSIHKVVVSPIVPYYCMTGSADGDIRVWDLRNITTSLIRIHHPTSVRAIAFSPSSTYPVQAVVGLDNGSLYRWDLKMGQRGQLDRIPVAHTGDILDLDWCSTSTFTAQNNTFSSFPGLGVFSENSASSSSSSGGSTNMGWIASGGLDRTVKIWDLTSAGASHIAHVPTYTLSTSFPVRKVLWRPSYECELAVVSNAEFGTGSSQDLLGGAGQSATEAADLEQLSKSDGEEAKQPTKASGDIGDAVEIWDVRRGYIAKWRVGGSSSEGGATDIEFADSHALWVQHASGTFSQLDLRHSYRPLDAIPRVAATWEASGSFAFVADKMPQWEIPYDDINPAVLPNPKGKLKALGDGPFRPTSQDVGYFPFENTPEDIEAFATMARGYVYEGADRHTICVTNAEVASNANRADAVQTWMLLQSLIPPSTPSPSRPPSPPLSPLPFVGSPTLPHSISAPAAIPTVSGSQNSTSSLLLPIRTSASDPMWSSPQSQTNLSPNQSPSRSGKRESSTSNSPSPRRVSSTVSAITVSPLASASSPSISSRPSSLFSRRQSNASFFPRPRAFSSFRRTSISTPSTAHGENTSAAPSLRGVGEGALDDSDSSGDESDGHPKDQLSPVSPEHRPRPPSAASSSTFSLRKTLGNTAHPSPLSHVAGQHTWTDEELDDGKDDDGSSPSPASTDTESGSASPPGSVRLGIARRPSHTRSKSSPQPQLQPQRPARARKGSVVRAKRSATLAVSAPQALVRETSRSSVRTVTAGDVSLEHERAPDAAPPAGERSPAKRVASFGASAGGDLFSPQSDYLRERRGESADERRYHAEVQRQEEQARGAAWAALRAALEAYADGGDLQMCAFMALVAPTELRVGERRLLQFVEGYIDMLTRRRLHTAAAYMRKYAVIDEVCASTNLQTTIYVSCGRCERPLAVQHGTSYCTNCSAFAATCSICHLPVRTALFHCGVCSHGGHQECCRRYLERPMVELAGPPAPVAPSAPPLMRGRSLSRGSAGALGEDFGETRADGGVGGAAQARRLMGHPCAAGCGHFCWVANERTEELDGDA